MNASKNRIFTQQNVVAVGANAATDRKHTDEIESKRFQCFAHKRPGIVAEFCRLI